MTQSRRKSKILVADLLCGAGGSSTGAKRALDEIGLDMELVCLNHWPTAIETHQKNHPEARHYVQDIATVRPHMVVPEGYLDLLMASPTCTHHSVARGGKPTSDQQRSDPWHIITWLTELRVKRIIIENVWEFCGWGPVDPDTGRPIPERKGEYFHAWIETIKRLGFDPEWRKLNAADYGDATTRQRFILMARSDGRKVCWPMPTHRKRDDAKASMFATAKPWRSASEIIDWSIKGKSIFGRKKPLAAKTLKRIYAGAVKHRWPEPFIVVLRNHMAVQDIDAPLPTITAGGGHIGIAQPVILNRHGDGYGKTRVHSIDDPLPTANCDGGGYLVEPFVLSQASGGSPRAVNQPLPTSTTGGAGGAHALISAYYGANASCTSDADPLPTVTTKDRFGIVVPVTHSKSGNNCRSVDEPIPTMTTAKGGEFALAEATDEYDILFRMLEPHELAAAMGFNTDDSEYEFAGTKTEKIKQIGNAVSVAKMKACVGAIMADAAQAEFLEAAE